jgi:hypothetical protein
MVLVGAVRDYLNRMLTDIPGMKVLILDAQTVCNFLFFFLNKIWNCFIKSYSSRIPSFFFFSGLWISVCVRVRDILCSEGVPYCI